MFTKELTDRFFKILDDNIPGLGKPINLKGSYPIGTKFQVREKAWIKKFGEFYQLVNSGNYILLRNLSSGGTYTTFDPSLTGSRIRPRAVCGGCIEGSALKAFKTDTDAIVIE